jgi:hypothetical protein
VAVPVPFFGGTVRGSHRLLRSAIHGRPALSLTLGILVVVVVPVREPESAAPALVPTLVLAFRSALRLHLRRGRAVSPRFSGGGLLALVFPEKPFQVPGVNVAVRHTSRILLVQFRRERRGGDAQPLFPQERADEPDHTLLRHLC